MNYERIDELLKGQGMSRRKLAMMAGINPGVLSMRYSRRIKHWPIADLEAIARVLGVDVAEIALTEDEKRVWQSEHPQWISVKDRLPEEYESIFYKLLGTPKWSNAMWRRESKTVLVYVSFPDGTGSVTTGCLHDSKWGTRISKLLLQTVTHWMPLPEPPKEENYDQL